MTQQRGWYGCTKRSLSSACLSQKPHSPELAHIGNAFLREPRANDGTFALGLLGRDENYRNAVGCASISWLIA